MSEQIIRLLPRPATAAAIAPYGTLIEPGEDGTPFGPADAQLELGRGTPRLYIMRIPHRPMLVRGITRHTRVTQCLAATGGADWFACLAPPGDPDAPDATPDPAQVVCFRIGGDVALALKRGTWHAGPFFTAPEQDFLNLELSDTNETDHHTVRFDANFGLVFEIVP
ncbi:ureidoglycolate lyase [Falsiroseomonas oryzae]|uniref:ureidoglycolate lyase n=1 Tax=Falsiroseomonas oryzae TaxID=2766473 RepID=UPI0022EA35D3|nr:ureidoglycolate lyase [Roseomonas sp. MO-31]